MCGNHFFKPLAWKNETWTVKNLFEIKNAQRVLFAGNDFALTVESSLGKAASDGGAIGAEIAALRRATSGVVP